MTCSTEAIFNKDSDDGGGVPQVESREVGSRDGEAEEGQSGQANGSDVAMADIGGDRDAVERRCCVREGETQSMLPGDGKGRAPGLN